MKKFFNTHDKLKQSHKVKQYEIQIIQRKQSSCEKKQRSSLQNNNDMNQRVQNSIFGLQNEQKESQQRCDWSHEEVQRLFSFYNQIGPKWSIIQKNFPKRDQISIKNRFYGTLKKLLRRLFKQFNNTPGKKLQRISAQQSVHIYLGQKKYKNFKGFMKECFKKTNYLISWSNIKSLVQQNKNMVQALYKVVLQPQRNSNQFEHQINTPLRQEISAFNIFQGQNFTNSMNPCQQYQNNLLNYSWDYNGYPFNVGYSWPVPNINMFFSNSEY